MWSLLKPSKNCKKSGQILIETAIVLPALIILTLGVIDLVRMLYVYEGLTGGVREGARYFISQPTPSGTPPVDPTPTAKQRVVSYFNNDPIGGNGRFGCVLQTSDVLVTNTSTGVTPPSVANWPGVGDMIRFRATTNVPLLIGGFFGLFGSTGSISLGSEIQMSYLGV